jgi:hypothetical protein
MTTYPGGGDGRFTASYTYREILDRLDRIEQRLDVMTGSDAAYKLLAGVAIGGIPATIVGVLATYFLTH